MVNSTRLLPAPTLWRTCRALANRRRLRLMQYLMRHSDLTVSAIADEARMPLSVASQYLRALNARGLLQARRVGRSVIYRVEADPAVPQAEPLLKALRASRREGTRGADKAFAALTGFTHPRRIALVRAMAESPLPAGTLADRTGMSRFAAARHLRKLTRRGYVRKGRGVYRYGRPRDPLKKALLELAARSA